MTTLADFTNTPRLGNLNTSLNGSEANEDFRQEPSFPRATSILFNSGNVVQSDRLKKRTNLNPQDELNEVLNNTLYSWLNSSERTGAQEEKFVKCRHPEFYQKLEQSEADELSISVKLFLNSLDYETVNQSIQTILDEIGTTQIDTLIVSFPDKIFGQDSLPKEVVMPLWQIVQNCIDSKVVGSAGLADFNANYLKQFLDSLEDTNRKPTLNQVNITSCCKMPEDLVEFAKIHNIQLTTHIDPKELLTVENLQSVMRKHTHDYDAHGWVNLWAARYTLILKGRGIVKSKGYIVNCQRELKYT